MLHFKCLSASSWIILFRDGQKCSSRGPGRRRDDNIKMDLKEIEYKGVD
jgi:hypothetical protein